MPGGIPPQQPTTGGQRERGPVNFLAERPIPNSRFFQTILDATTKTPGLRLYGITEPVLYSHRQDNFFPRVSSEREIIVYLDAADKIQPIETVMQSTPRRASVASKLQVAYVQVKSAIAAVLGSPPIRENHERYYEGYSHRQGKRAVTGMWGPQIAYEGNLTPQDLQEYINATDGVHLFGDSNRSMLARVSPDVQRQEMVDAVADVTEKGAGAREEVTVKIYPTREDVESDHGAIGLLIYPEEKTRVSEK